MSLALLASKRYQWLKGIYDYKKYSLKQIQP